VLEGGARRARAQEQQPPRRVRARVAAVPARAAARARRVVTVLARAAAARAAAARARAGAGLVADRAALVDAAGIVGRPALAGLARQARSAGGVLVDHRVAVVVEEVALFVAGLARGAGRGVAVDRLAPAPALAALRPHALVHVGVAVVVEAVADLLGAGVDRGVLGAAVARRARVAGQAHAAHHGVAALVLELAVVPVAVGVGVEGDRDRVLVDVDVAVVVDLVAVLGRARVGVGAVVVAVVGLEGVALGRRAGAVDPRQVGAPEAVPVEVAPVGLRRAAEHEVERGVVGQVARRAVVAVGRDRPYLEAHRAGRRGGGPVERELRLVAGERLGLVVGEPRHDLGQALPRDRGVVTGIGLEEQARLVRGRRGDRHGDDHRVPGIDHRGVGGDVDRHHASPVAAAAAAAHAARVGPGDGGRGRGGGEETQGDGGEAAHGGSERDSIPQFQGRRATGTAAAAALVKPRRACLREDRPSLRSAPWPPHRAWCSRTRCRCRSRPWCRPGSPCVRCRAP
jgi:hypothetical protein